MAKQALRGWEQERARGWSTTVHLITETVLNYELALRFFVARKGERVAGNMPRQHVRGAVTADRVANLRERVVQVFWDGRRLGASLRGYQARESVMRLYEDAKAKTSTKDLMKPAPKRPRNQPSDLNPSFIKLSAGVLEVMYGHKRGVGSWTKYERGEIALISQSVVEKVGEIFPHLDSLWHVGPMGVPWWPFCALADGKMNSNEFDLWGHIVTYQGPDGRNVLSVTEDDVDLLEVNDSMSARLKDSIRLINERRPEIPVVAASVPSVVKDLSPPNYEAIRPRRFQRNPSLVLPDTPNVFPYSPAVPSKGDNAKTLSDEEWGMLKAATTNARIRGWQHCSVADLRQLIIRMKPESSPSDGDWSKDLYAFEVVMIAVAAKMLSTPPGNLERWCVQVDGVDYGQQAGVRYQPPFRTELFFALVFSWARIKTFAESHGLSSSAQHFAFRFVRWYRAAGSKRRIRAADLWDDGVSPLSLGSHAHITIE